MMIFLSGLCGLAAGYLRRPLSFFGQFEHQQHTHVFSPLKKKSCGSRAEQS